MTHSKQYVRYPSAISEEKLSKRFGLFWDKNTQDWDIVTSDSGRIRDFIKIYQTELDNDDDKFTLMGLIISSFDDAAPNFDKEIKFSAEDIAPMVTYGTNPGMGISIADSIPSLQSESFDKSLDYMSFEKGESLINKQIQNVFIGSCTNSRIEDLRAVAAFVSGKKKADHVKAMIVPGSKLVETQAQEEGLDKIFEKAGFELRQPGCSACLGMNEDKIPSGEYCISTSNRNFEGRQGQGARTILASPLMAAAAAIEGKIVDVRNYLN